jgi:hypothetical protein
MAKNDKVFMITDTGLVDIISRKEYPGDGFKYKDKVYVIENTSILHSKKKRKIRYIVFREGKIEPINFKITEYMGSEEEKAKQDYTSGYMRSHDIREFLNIVKTPWGLFVVSFMLGSALFFIIGLLASPHILPTIGIPVHQVPPTNTTKP